MNMGRKANLVAYKLLQNEVIYVVDRPVSVAQSSAQTYAGILRCTGFLYIWMSIAVWGDLSQVLFANRVMTFT